MYINGGHTSEMHFKYFFGIVSYFYVDIFVSVADLKQR